MCTKRTFHLKMTLVRPSHACICTKISVHAWESDRKNERVNESERERERRQGSGQSHRPQDLTLCFCMERKATWAASVCVSSMFYAFCLFVMISDSAEGRTLGSGVQRKGGGRACPSLLRRTWSCLLKLASAPVAGYTVITHGLHNTAACAGKLLG